MKPPGESNGASNDAGHDAAPAARDAARQAVDVKTTGLIHHPYRAPDNFGAVPVAVHKASTILFSNAAALRARTWKEKTGYTYGLHGTPTSFVLEERIATLEGGLQTLLVPSGLAAISLVDLAMLKTGDWVAIPDNAYGPSMQLARNELAGFGIHHHVYDAMDPASLDTALASAADAATRLVWIEPPGSVTMEFPDVPALLQVARKHSAVTALDNTWGAGIAFNAFNLGPDPSGGDGSRCGVDICIQALTKYPSGGADLLMGSVTTRDEALHLKLKFAHMRMGWGVAANDIEFVLRSLPTLALRYAAQDRAGRQLAQWWIGRPETKQVLHPALPGSPGHVHWKALCGGSAGGAAAGLFSVVFDDRYGAAQVDAFVDALRLFKIGYSWAGPVSLAVPYDLSLLRGQAGRTGHLVRFSVGLEAVDDLIADMEQALGALA